jgi:hypothetical protein
MAGLLSVRLPEEEQQRSCFTYGAVSRCKTTVAQDYPIGLQSMGVYGYRQTIIFTYTIIIINLKPQTLCNH